MEQDPLEMTKTMMSSSGLDFSPGALAAGFVFSVVGLYLFRAGRKRLNNGVIYTSIALMVYPLFLNGALKLWAVGFLLSGLAYYFWVRGDSE